MPLRKSFTGSQAWLENECQPGMPFPEGAACETGFFQDRIKHEQVTLRKKEIQHGKIRRKGEGK